MVIVQFVCSTKLQSLMDSQSSWSTSTKTRSITICVKSVSHHYGEKYQDHSLEGISTFQVFFFFKKQEAAKTEGKRDKRLLLTVDRDDSRPQSVRNCMEVINAEQLVFRDALGLAGILLLLLRRIQMWGGRRRLWNVLWNKLAPFLSLSSGADVFGWLLTGICVRFGFFQTLVLFMVQ